MRLPRACHTRFTPSAPAGLFVRLRGLFPHPVVRALILAGGLVAVSTAVAAAPSDDAGGYPPLFGSSEARSSRMALFPKWQGTLSRYFDERRLADAPCVASAFNRCHLKAWTRFLESLKDRDPLIQIAEVNRYVNRKRYIVDPRNYGVVDYWATPRQFFDRNGDCEDYAIAKFMSLRALGFDDARLRIVVLQDLNLGIAHAVLVVYHKGEALVLDNQVQGVVPARAIRHYRPIYSLNEHSWWLHRL